jgi:hypothetical protein
LDLLWMVPSSCPDADAERTEIRRRVGAMDPAQMPERISAKVEIHAEPGGALLLTLRTSIGATTGERFLTGHDCRQLSDAVALVLALLINPNAAAGDAPPPPPLLPPPPPPIASAELAERAPFALGVEAVLAEGVLPNLAEGVAGGLSFQRGGLVLAARGGGFFAQDQPAPVLAGARASFYLIEAALEICVRTWPGRRLGATACLGGAIERLHGESSGVSSSGQASALWPEALARIMGHLRLGQRTRLRLGAEAHGLGSRPDLAIRGLGSVYRPPAVSMRASLGIDMLF